jgi:hypothetical protein
MTSNVFSTRKLNIRRTFGDGELEEREKEEAIKE